MTIVLTDDWIDRAAHEMTSNSTCRKVLFEPDMRWEHSRVCNGTLRYKNGKVTFHGTCGAPCSFVCDTGRTFERSVQTIRSVVSVLNKTRRK